MLQHAYTALATRLQSAFPSPNGLWIDLYNAQLDGADNLPLAFPAVLIEFANINWTRQNNGVKLGECLLRVHIAQESYTDSFYLPNGQAINNQQNALDVLQFVADINTALENFAYTAPPPLTPLSGGQGGLAWGGFTHLVHTATIVDHDHDALHHHINEYTTTLIDNGYLIAQQASTLTTIITDANIQPNTLSPPQPLPPTPYII